MNDLELEIGNLRSTIDLVLSKIDLLSTETYDILFPEMLNSIKKIYIYKNELLRKYSLDMLLGDDKEFTEKTKLIRKKIDNIIEKYSVNLRKLELEISNLSAKKKLINYKR